MADTTASNPPFSPPTGLVSFPGLIPNAGWLGTTDASSIADIDYGAQLGFGPNLPNLDGATPLVLSPIVGIVTHIPTMFAGIDGAPNTIKSLFERHPKQINGIDFGITLGTAETPVGQDGQMMHIPTDAKRTPVNPSFVWQELQGNLVWNMIKTWIYMIRHPDTQASMLSSMNLNSSMAPMLASVYTMTLCFIQFDTTFRPENIIDAFFITNMFPTETGMGGFKREIAHSEPIDRTVAFTGIVQHNRNTKAVAQTMASMIGLHRANYEFAIPVGSNPTGSNIDDNILGMGLQSPNSPSSPAAPFGAIIPTISDS